MGLAIITGGSRGLGAALADEYRGRDWDVVEFSRTAPYDFSVQVDLADPMAAAEAFTRAFEPLVASNPTEVVAVSNAAALGPVGPLERSSPEAIAEHIEISVTSAILFARAFVGAFQHLDCPKHLVNITSGAATKGYAGWSLYCASKAAMENFIRSVAAEQEARQYPITAISVSPGVMDTDMQASVRGSSAEDFPEVGRFIRYHERGMLSPPAAVAGRIARIVASRPEPGRVYSAER